MGKAVDITNQRYGRLVAIRVTDQRDGAGSQRWLFKCDCGNEKILSINPVRQGRVKSCGCLSKPHGKTGTRLHTIWCSMRERCKNDGRPEHENWGGRGITICDEWNDYKVFEQWALNNGYNDNLTIDRIDNNKGYEPTNCRWATYKDQARNTRRNHYITIGNETHLVDDWCQILGTVNKSSVYRRVRAGWSFEKALLTPAQKRIPLNPEEAEAKRKARCHPLIAESDKGDMLFFESLHDAQKAGFYARSIKNSMKRGIRHKGYRWRYAKKETA